MSPMPMGRTTECSFRGWPPQPLSKVMCDVQPREQCAAAASFTIHHSVSDTTHTPEGRHGAAKPAVYYTARAGHIPRGIKVGRHLVAAAHPDRLRASVVLRVKLGGHKGPSSLG